MSSPVLSMQMPTAEALSNPWCQIAFALSVAGALPPLVMSILKVLRQPEIQAAGRWMAQAARRAWAAIQAAMTVPDPRRRRPLADMALTLMEGTLYYLFAMNFLGWFAFGVVAIAERWGSFSLTKCAGMFVYELAMMLLVRFYAERGRRTRADLRRRWRGLRLRRWQAATAMACVPTGLVLLAVGTELFRNGGIAT